jgi:hypothetical protein
LIHLNEIQLGGELLEYGEVNAPSILRKNSAADVSVSRMGS